MRNRNRKDQNNRRKQRWTKHSAISCSSQLRIRAADSQRARVRSRARAACCCADEMSPDSTMYFSEKHTVKQDGEWKPHCNAISAAESLLPIGSFRAFLSRPQQAGRGSSGSSAHIRRPQHKGPRSSGCGENLSPRKTGADCVYCRSVSQNSAASIRMAT